jgi:hypothetical protein
MFCKCLKFSAWLAIVIVGFNSAYAQSRNTERAISEFGNNLNAAISQIGQVETTLVVDAVTTVSGNVTVPATLKLRFSGPGQLSIANGVSVTITDGTRLEATPTKQIFAGPGVVKFTGTYPEWFHPGWWGAAMDDTGRVGTDDLAAFNAMMTSMQRPAALAINTTYQGGMVKLPSGRSSYLSDTLHIRRPLSMIGNPSDYNQPAFSFRFPPNKTGFVVHGLSTFDGSSQKLQQGAFSSFEGFMIYGAQGTDNTELSINGLNVTLTGGAIIQVARNGSADGSVPAIAPGSTIRINGYNYIIADTLSATATRTVPLESPRIFVNSSGRATLTEATGDVISFPSKNDWVGKTIECQVDQGAQLYRQTITAMTTKALNLDGAMPAANYTCKVSGSTSQSGVKARLNIYHGIDARITSKYRNITIQRFAGNGWQCHSEQLPTFYPGAEPNCNNSQLERVHSYFNAGTGVLLWGINSNNVVTQQLNLENNRGFGLFEQSLGSNHYGFHIAYNGQGAFKAGFSAGQSRIDSSYSEGAQPSALLGPSSSATGNFGAGFDRNNGYSNYLYADGYGQIASDSGFVFRRKRGSYLSIDNPKAVAFSIGTANQSNTLAGFGAAEEHYNLASGGSIDVVLKPVYQLGYDQLRTGWYSLYFGGNLSTDQDNSLLAMSGSTAAEGGGKLWLRNGIHFLGTARDVGLTRSNTNTLKVTDGASGAGQLVVQSIQLESGSRPACNTATRFKIWAVAGGPGVADTFEVCRKDARDNYNWVSLP